MKKYKNLFERIVSVENLFLAWDRFKQDKHTKNDVLKFEAELEQNIFALRRSLGDKTYKHGDYVGFRIHDPKLREIHKAEVRDRVLHHAIFNVLNPIFEPTFIPMSFSCRVGKGTHAGVRAVAKMLRAESRNDTRPCFALKCDVRKFFDSVDHAILFEILARRIGDTDTLSLLRGIIESYAADERQGGGFEEGGFRSATSRRSFLPTCT